MPLVYGEDRVASCVNAVLARHISSALEISRTVAAYIGGRYRVICSQTNMDSSNSADTPSKKRVSDFLASCVDVKKRKVDLGVLIARKEGEKRRCEEQIAKLKARIIDLTKDLSAKEMQLDSIETELHTLHEEKRTSC